MKKLLLLSTLLLFPLQAEAATISPVNIGTTANDGTGDPNRTAFGKINSNFTALNSGTANYLAGYDGSGVLTSLQPGANCSISSGVFNCSGGTTSPLTSKGDIYTFSTANTRLAVGADNTCLIADSTQTTGLKWGACSTGGSGTPGGSTGQIQYNNAGSFAGSTATIDASGNLGSVGTIASGAQTITATSANAFVVGQNGTTNPGFTVNTNTASSANGVQLTTSAAGSSTGPLLQSTSSAGNENITLSSKGSGGSSGAVYLNTGTSAGAIRMTYGGVATPVYQFTQTATTFSPAASAGVHYVFNGAADNNIPAGSVQPVMNLAFTGTRTHLVGALTNDPWLSVTCGTTAFSGASTATDSSCAYIAGPPSAGTNASFGAAHALQIAGGAVSGSPPVADGLNVSAPTGAISNFAIRATGPSSFQGGLQFTRTTVTTGASYTVLANDYGILVNKGTGSATTINIPTCTTGGTIDGRILRIADEKGDAATNNITITPTSGTVQNAASLAISANYGKAILQCDGASGNWAQE
ncbi:hypothetical protein [Roseicella sp. DB1501]|uniref:hypothetical protein n=1 Tax=Roseicella sp. DB1501 TaxID=2730925 RepID=UPI0014932038|nr:hypothetical protein [Roseicella sp. DB1501]NOG70502.1 hypothetical protein [Roseicella sp. DB1501]